MGSADTARNVGTALIHEHKSRPTTLLVLFALIGFAVYAHVTHVRAEDIQEIKTEVAAVKKAQETTDEKVDQILLMQTAESIRTLSRELCDAPPPERGRLERMIDNAQTSYQKLSPDGMRYPIPPC